MHPNRKRISQSNLKISPSGKKGRKKLKKITKKEIKTATVRPRIKKGKLRITKSSYGRLKIGDSSKYKPISKWKNLLKEHPAFILGNAPSISKQNLKLLDKYFTIGINRIFYIYTPTILIWQDVQMWNKEKKNILKQKSIKICNSVSDPVNIFLNFEVKEGGFKFRKNPEVLHGWGNTGALAIQVAVNLGCSEIILLGTDCEYTTKKKTDFYGKNPDHKSYTLKMCNDAMGWVKKKCPVPVYNCSNNKLWPTEKLLDVIKKINPPKMGFKKYKEIFKK